MLYLFVDSCEELSVGILDEEFNWLEYVATNNKKSSGTLHGLIEKMLDKHGKVVSDLTALIYSSGPGSYTGMRVAEGLAQILDWQGLKRYSFYHFEVPKLLGYESGYWVNSAFKGEVFIYSWEGENDEYQLIREEELKLDGDNIYTGSYTKIKAVLTSELINKEARKLFTKVISDKMRREPYYYRPIDQEFKKPT